MQVDSLKDTTLYNHLSNGYSGNDGILAKELAIKLDTICRTAADRMKKTLCLHPQYTLHDEVHLVRVTELMAKLLGKEMVEALNPVETAILILSAYYHDIGMVIDDDEINTLETKDDFQLYKSNWIIDHPNHTEINRYLTDNNNNNNQISSNAVRAQKELDSAMLTNYIRINHGTFAQNYIIEKCSNEAMWKIEEVSLAPIVAKICFSHCIDSSELTRANGFYIDENVSTYRVNTLFLAIILRLADVLDFDRERTPSSLYKTIHFSNNVSLCEWEKHRSIMGWEILDKLIRFTAKCTHPIYQRTVLQFMDLIDNELNKCHALVREFPQIASRYKLNLPCLVDRSRIAPKDNNYIYHDLEFSISRDEIVKLLMMDELYKSPSLCVRELLQNSMDALRLRKARMKYDLNVNWSEGKVEFVHAVDKYGRETLTCIDNGTGMDEEIIEKFLTKSGRSYYKSPEFEHEKATLKTKDIVFEPCSQFGIGFMSCFMIGDQIRIETRKDYGDGKPHGKPLIVDISGLNGIISIREGKADQAIGTTVIITGRLKPNYLDEWVDQIRLVDVLEGYDLACEFPVVAHCTIEEIASEITIPAGCADAKTFIELQKLPSSCYKTYKQDFSEINLNMKGEIRVSFLVDELGHLVLSNKEASWVPKDDDKRCELVVNNCQGQLYSDRNTSTCCDGILVCGKPGRSDKAEHRLGWWANVIDVGLEAFVVDFRNNIRPQLSPSRMAREDHNDKHPSWQYAQDLIDLAQGKLWGKVLMDTDSDEDVETFIIIAAIYRFDLSKLSPKLIWEKLRIPINDNGNYTWIKLSSVSEIAVKQIGKDTFYYVGENRKIETDENTSKYNSSSYGVSIYNTIIRAIQSISALDINGDSILILHVLNPHETKYPTGRNKYDSQIFRTLIIPYCDSSNRYFAIQSPFRNINANHPMVMALKDKPYLRKGEALVDFFTTLMYFANDESNFKDIKEGKITRTMKHIGCRYILVDWTKCPKSYMPDYHIFVSQYGDVKLSDQQFRLWASIKSSDLAD